MKLRCTKVIWTLIFSFFLLICMTFGLPDSIRSSLQIITESRPEPCEEFADYGDTVEVHYLGMLDNGEVFDSTASRKAPPMKLTLGSGNVIKGFVKGVQGMCVGETRKVIIPPSLAYGSRGLKGVIPGAATLIFSVQLMGLEKFSWIPNTDRILLAGSMFCAAVVMINYFLTIVKNSTNGDRKTERRHGKKRR